MSHLLKLYRPLEIHKLVIDNFREHHYQSFGNPTCHCKWHKSQTSFRLIENVKSSCRAVCLLYISRRPFLERCGPISGESIVEWKPAQWSVGEGKLGRQKRRKKKNEESPWKLKVLYAQWGGSFLLETGNSGRAVSRASIIVWAEHLKK